ncbi:MAG: aminopeptidase, partial [Saprospiraceae bacterium]
MKNILQKYAHLLVNYCLEIKEGDWLYVRSTTLAEPLIREVYRETLRAGGHIETNLSVQGQGRIFNQEAAEHQLKMVSPFYQHAIEKFDAYLYIRAPFNLRAGQNNDPEKGKISQQAHREISKIYSQRTATRDLRRNLCQYPTIASAQNAGMSLEEYEHFVFNACKLYADDP